jgi:hypothetical protein
VKYVAGTACFFEGKTSAVKTYSDLINIICYAGVSIFHPDTNDFGLFSEVGKNDGNTFKLVGTRILVSDVNVSISIERSAEIL